MDKTPIYKYPLSRARENNELPQYRASMQSLARCRAAIEAVISEQWTGMGFPEDAAKGVLKEFGTEKVALVLAYTVREREHDTRISGHNQSWAKTIPKYSIQPDNSDIRISSHPAKLDAFLDVAQKNILEAEQEKKQSRSSSRRPSVKRRAAKPDKIPVYRETFEYAQAHDEIEKYHASMQVNTACKEAIEAAIRGHYAGNCLDSVPAVQEVVKQFGYDRMFYVLANSIQEFANDGRVSRQNKEWARTVPVVKEKKSYFIVSGCNPGLLSMFVQSALHEHLLTQPLKRADIKAEASRILEQLQAQQEPNSPDRCHYMTQISPDFVARAGTKEADRLMAMLPFCSLTFSTLAGHQGTFALISQDENRFQKLVLRKPSVRKKLQELTAPPKTSGPSREKEQVR